MLFLRPTESAIVFLQQLGRGLRLCRGKSCLTVLDFIGQAHRSFRFDLRYRALLGGSRDQLKQQIKDGFPFLPAGCSLQLDRVSSERVLANLRESLPSRRPQLLAECRRLGRCSLAALLEGLGMELGEFYKVAGSWALLQRELGWLAAGAASGEPSDDEKRLGRGIAGGLLHLDDPERLRWLVNQLQRALAPDPAVLDLVAERRWRMLMAQLWGSGRQHLPLAEALVRLWVAADLRAELVELFKLLLERTDHLVAPLPWPFLAAGSQPRPCPWPPRPLLPRRGVRRLRPAHRYPPFPGREGVFFDATTQCDVFFITLKKSERLFSPTTRYNDYAISPWEFHWESQSLTREASATGQRYIHHVERGSRVLLFVREENRRGGVTMPFHCLGFADYVSHERERPMAIRWRLQRAIPGAFYPELAVAV